MMILVQSLFFGTVVVCADNSKNRFTGWRPQKPPSAPGRTRGEIRPESIPSWADPYGNNNSNRRQPIHYQFPATSTTPPPHEGTGTNNDDATNRPAQQKKFASARQDAITRFQSQSRGHYLLLILSCTFVGGCSGAWLGRSLHITTPCTILFALAFTIFSLIRGDNAYGELVRALGAAVIFSFQRFPAIRRKYPARYYLWAGLTRRRDYRPLKARETTNTLFVMICLACAGSLIGGSFPLIPTWLGSLAGAAVASVSCLPNESPWGDMSYCMGLRILSVVTTIGELNGDLELLSKTGAAMGKLTNTLLVWDRQHRIQERAASFAAWVKDRVTSSSSSEDTPRPPRQRRRRPPPDDTQQQQRPKRERPPPPRQPPPPPPKDPPPSPPHDKKKAPVEEPAKTKTGFFGLFRGSKQSEEEDKDDIFEGWDFGGDSMEERR